MVILNVLLILLFHETSPVWVAFTVLYIVGLWRLFEKSGIKGWWAVIPCASEYQLARCAGRESEGPVLSVTMFGITAITLIEYLYTLTLRESASVTGLALLLSVLAIVVSLIHFFYHVRVWSGMIEVYGVKKRWMILCLFTFTKWIPALIWGFKSGYQPQWQVEDIRAQMEKLAFHGSAEVMDEGLTVNLRERSVVEFFQKKTLLRDIHMAIPQGHMVLLLGGSGAGKTTYLNAINGYEPAKAEVVLNGTNMYKHYKKMQYEVGFVPQTEMMRGKDTVINTLLDAAKLRLPMDVSPAQRKARVEEVMEIFGLTPVKTESVTEGHPDKICDQISDAVLDAILAKDPNAHVACECCATTGMVMVMGEISTTAYVPIEQIVRRKVVEIGYDRAKYGFDGYSCAVLTTLDEQSPDIAQGVDRADADQGAGDQGIMFGYACDETPEYMPTAIAYAHRLARRLAQVRKDGTLPYLRPDGKSQVTVEYDDDRVARIDAVVLSTQHAPDVSQETIREDMLRHVIRPVLPEALLDQNTRYYVNPTGRFVIGGPQGDSGLTGRKIIVDTYGGYAHHGGGAFSGKDPSKVDRSAAYAARHAAKNLVAAGLARKCEIGVAYAIGVAEPVSILVDSFGTGTLPDDALSAIVREVFDLRPAAIIRDLDLKRPIYAQTAAYGHFGRDDLDLPWERLDRVDALRRAAGR